MTKSKSLPQSFRQLREKSPKSHAPCFWMHGIDEKNTGETVEKLKNKGFSGVVLSDPRLVEKIRPSGIEIWLLSSCFRVNDIADEQSTMCMDVTGRKQVWLGGGCPNNPILAERNRDEVRKLAGVPGIKGIILDRCRFIPPVAGLNGFLTCFDEHCENKAKELGYDFNQIRKDVRFIYQLLKSKKQIRERRGLMWFKGPAGIVEWLMDHPGLLEWLRFRRDCITEHVRSLADIVHHAGLRVGVYAYTPSLAPLVGQSYVDWSDFVDVFCPILFRKLPYRPGEGCLTWEITAIPDELGVIGTSIESIVTSIMLSWTRMTGPVTDRTISALRANGISPEAAAREVILARSLVGKNRDIFPVLYMEDPLLPETVRLMFSNTANGMNFYSYKDNWEKHMEQVAQE